MSERRTSMPVWKTYSAIVRRRSEATRQFA